MLFRKGVAVAAALTLLGSAGAAAAQELEIVGRYQLTAEGDGYLRLDTQTGSLSYCALSGGRWRCQPADMQPGTTADFAVLAERIEALEGTLSAVIETLADPAGAASAADIAALSGQLAGIEAQLAAVEPDSGLAVLTARVEELAAGQEALAALIGSAESPDQTPLLEALEALAERQTGVEAALGEIVASGGAATGIEEQLTLMSSRLAALGIAVEELLQQPPSVAGATPEELDALLAGIELRLDAGAGATPSLLEEVDGLETLLAELAARQASLEESLAGLAVPDLTPLADFAADMTAIRERLAALEAGLAERPAEAAPDMSAALADLAARQEAIVTIVEALVGIMNSNAAAPEPTEPPVVETPAPEETPAEAPVPEETPAEAPPAEAGNGFGDELMLRLFNLADDLERDLAP